MVCLQGQPDGGATYIGGAIKYMILPNLIWKPGRVAAKIRKAAVTVLCSVASRAIPRPEDYLAVPSSG